MVPSKVVDSRRNTSEAAGKVVRRCRTSLSTQKRCLKKLAFSISLSLLTESFSNVDCNFEAFSHLVCRALALSYAR
jgi:hypothetical protein